MKSSVKGQRSHAPTFLLLYASSDASEGKKQKTLSVQVKGHLTNPSSHSVCNTPVSCSTLPAVSVYGQPSSSPSSSSLSLSDDMVTTGAVDASLPHKHTQISSSQHAEPRPCDLTPGFRTEVRGQSHCRLFYFKSG